MSLRTNIETGLAFLSDLKDRSTHLANRMTRPASQPELTRVSKLHFLIHPGYSSNAELMRRYIVQAGELTQDEAMFIFSLTHSQEGFRLALQKQESFAQTIAAIQGILGNRVIVVNDGWVIFNTELDSDGFKSTARAQGLLIDRAAASEAYGEMFGCCVTEGAQTLNRAFGLNRKTMVIPNLTDLAFSSYSIPEMIPDMNMSRLTRVDFLET